MVGEKQSPPRRKYKLYFIDPATKQEEYTLFG
jgi:hypothetical protein